jgi:hypothetical protein
MICIPDNYYIRVIFKINIDCKDTDTDTVDFANGCLQNNFFDGILTKLSLSKINYHTTTGICGCEQFDNKYFIKPYWIISDKSIKISIRFYNTYNEKWTFEELNIFMKLFEEIAEDSIDSIDSIDTIEFTKFIELQLE